MTQLGQSYRPRCRCIAVMLGPRAYSSMEGFAPPVVWQLEGERTIALKELKDVQDLISANPSFDSGDDRRRIVALYAGLSLFEKSGQDWWLRLKQNYSWSQEWLDAKQITNSQSGWEQAG